MPETIFKEYDAKLDKKQRCPIQGVPFFNHFHIKVFSTGRIEMTPRFLADTEELSDRTFKMIYKPLKNLKRIKAGPTVVF